MRGARQRALHQQADVAPGILGDRSEIFVGDVEATDQDARRLRFGIGKRQLLVVPKKVTPPVGRVEPAEARLFGKRGEIIVGVSLLPKPSIRSETATPIDRANDGLPHPFTGLVRVIDVIEQAKRRLRAVDQRD